MEKQIDFSGMTVVEIGKIIYDGLPTEWGQIIEIKKDWKRDKPTTRDICTTAMLNPGACEKARMDWAMLWAMLAGGSQSAFFGFCDECRKKIEAEGSMEFLTNTSLMEAVHASTMARKDLHSTRYANGSPMPAIKLGMPSPHVADIVVDLEEMKVDEACKAELLEKIDKLKKCQNLIPSDVYNLSMLKFHEELWAIQEKLIRDQRILALQDQRKDDEEREAKQAQLRQEFGDLGKADAPKAR